MYVYSAVVVFSKRVQLYSGPPDSWGGTLTRRAHRDRHSPRHTGTTSHVTHHTRGRSYSTKRGQRSRYNRVENSSVTMKSPTASSDSRWLLVVFITLLRPESSSAALLDKPPQIVKDLNQKMTLKLGPLNRSVAITTSQCKHLELTTEISVMQ